MRTNANDEPEVLLVHRPRYGDWSLPKGKAKRGETDEECALREVEEETGLRCALGRELASTEYLDRRDRPKVVR
jgi:8-oxo-dGTP pyrophosphatase MutT (NUDIX family)